MSRSGSTHDESVRFGQDVDLLLTGREVAATGDESYQADLKLARLLNRARFVPPTGFRIRLRSVLLNKVYQKEGKEMKRPLRSFVRPVLMATLAAVLVAGIVFIITPTGRAIAQGWVARFVEADSPWDLLRGPSDAESSRGELDEVDESDRSTGASGGITAPPGVPAPSLPSGMVPGPDQLLISLEEAQATTDFSIKVPRVLPEGYSLKGVLAPPAPPELEEPLPADGEVAELPSVVTLVFENEAGDLLMLSESTLLTEAQTPVGEGSVQEVTINGQPGQYIKGSWTPQGWDAEANHHLLHWQGTDGLIYDLISGQLGLEDLLAMAESIP